MSFLLYGAYGYTGRLIAQRAVDQNKQPILAGRDPHQLDAMGEALGLPTRTVSLEERERLANVLDGVETVLHCAGPFIHTSEPMVEACLQTGTNYLDITGEIDVFRALARRDEEARAEEVTMVPGVGFDVVPTDCLAAYLHEQLPDATALEIAIYAQGTFSQGTLKTALEQAHTAGLVRREGALKEVPPGWTARTVDFGDHPRTVISVPWGDLVTAERSTGIPNVTVYLYLPRLMRRVLRLSRYVQPLLQWQPLKQLLQRLIEWGTSNPSPDERRRGRTVVWARVTDGSGREHAARLQGPEAYTFTARSALAAVEQVGNGAVASGFQTPATAFGSSFVLDVEGVKREDVE